MTLRRILVPTDFSECADSALAHAVQLADRFEATLHLLHVVNELDAAWYGLTEAEERTVELGTQIESEARERLYDLAPDSSTIDVQTDVVRQLNLDVTHAIQEYVTEHAIDLVVMGTHGRRGIGRLMLGSVANTLTRRAPCPVLTVRTTDADEGEAKESPYRHILAPIDFSEHSHNALRLSKQVAARYGAHLHLLFIAERRVLPQFSDTGLPGVNVVEMDPELVENAQAALEALNDSVGGPSVDSTYHVKKGDVAEGIVDFAEETEIDLVVMATRGLTGVTRFVLGSNTERVVRAAPCPVITVPPEPSAGDDR